MSQQLWLSTLNTKEFKTTRQADELSEKLSKKLGSKHRYEPARLAIARSLSVPEPPTDPAETEMHEDGGPIKGQHLFGEDLAVWVALLVQHSGRPDIQPKDIQDSVRRHWHRGINLLMAEWKECRDDFDRFVLHLAERSGVREGGQLGNLPSALGSGVRLKDGPVILRLGPVSTEVLSNKPVTWLMNGRGYAPHVAIMGKAGSGKTSTGMEMLSQVRQQTGCPILLFDIEKGDLARKPELRSEFGATVIKAPEQAIPLDVLHMAERSDASAKVGASRFRDSFKSVSQSRPGAKQLDSLRDGVQRALLSGKTPITIKDVHEAVKQVYAEKKQKTDAVMSTFNDLTQWELFSPKLPPESFFSQSWIIGLHDAPETEKRMIVFLLFDALYAYCRTLEDAPLDAEGHRVIRLCVGIDEANKVLGYGHQSLIDLVRTSRSKGIAVFFMSQSPDDYDKEDENFLENIGLAISFHSAALYPRALEKLLGSNVNLAELPLDGTAITRLPNSSSPVRFKAW